MAVVHADDRLTGLLYPVQDLSVFDLLFGVALDLGPNPLPVSVVFTGVGSHVGQDGQLGDVRVVFPDLLL